MINNTTYSSSLPVRGGYGRRQIATNVVGYLLFVALVYLASPVFSLFFQIVTLGFLKSRSKALYLNLILSLSFFLGLLNTTKVPESDMLNYLSWFDLASTMSSYDYIWMHGKEPAYHAIVYLLYLVFPGSQDAFIMGITAIGYFLVLYSLLRLALAAALLLVFLTGRTSITERIGLSSLQPS